MAASRRNDRSLEARILSAQMASSIHKKRTGKGLRITKEIVLNDEMYEEDDGNLQRFCHARKIRGAALYDSRIYATASGQVALKEAWKDNSIDIQFAQAFPNATALARQAFEDVILQAYLPAENAWSAQQSTSSQSTASIDFQSGLDAMVEDTPTTEEFLSSPLVDSADTAFVTHLEDMPPSTETQQTSYALSLAILSDNA